jgi:DNA-binding phage protein
MAKTATTAWDPAERLTTAEDMAAYLEAALEEGTPLSSLRRSATSRAPRA